jgi:Ran GTPase-activating protein (RanGAP) involved in mRNA processing and transport
MSVSNDSTALSTLDNGRAVLSSTFLEFCVKVRNNDPSILPESGKPFKIRCLSEREHVELADALLENSSVTYLELETAKYTKSSAEAMAKYVRTSKRLQRIRLYRWLNKWETDNRKLQHCEEMFCCFLPALQESTSLKKLDIDFPPNCGPSNLAFGNILTHTQTLLSLNLRIPPRHIDVAAIQSGLNKNTTLQELTLDLSRGATSVYPILTSLRDHPSLRRLCLRGDVGDLTEIETLLLSDNSKITELEIHRLHLWLGPPLTGLPRVLEALARHPTLTKLGLRHCVLGCDEARQLGTVLCNIPSLQSLDLKGNGLGSAGLAELAPGLSRNTSIKVLNISENNLMDIESAELFRKVLRSNKTMTALDLSQIPFRYMAGAVDCIVDGLGSNSTLLKIDLSNCALGDEGVSSLAQAFGARNTTLQKLKLGLNVISSSGIGVLLEAMEHSSHITDLELDCNPIEDKGATLLARALENNALRNLTRLSLLGCGIGDDGFIALVSALEQNTSLLYLDLRSNYAVSERAYLALAGSLPQIKVLQQVDLSWCPGLVSAMPLLLIGLRTNTSLFRFHVAHCVPSSVPPTPGETARCAGGWKHEVERLGYRNRFLPLLRAPPERLPPLGVWSHALARVTILPDVIFEVLRSKPDLVLSEDTEGKEVAEDTSVLMKRKRGDE